MAVNNKSSFLRGSERSLRLAVGLLTKTFLQNLERLQDRPQFPHLWNRILQVPTRDASRHTHLIVVPAAEPLPVEVFALTSNMRETTKWSDCSASLYAVVRHDWDGDQSRVNAALHWGPES